MVVTKFGSLQMMVRISGNLTSYSETSRVKFLEPAGNIDAPSTVIAHGTIKDMAMLHATQICLVSTVTR